MYCRKNIGLTIEEAFESITNVLLNAIKEANNLELKKVEIDDPTSTPPPSMT